MTLLTPLGLLGLLGIVALIIIYIIRPNYQQKFVSTTFVWKLSLKYRKRKIPISKLRNILIIICQILILTGCAFILAQPNQVLKAEVEEAEIIAIIDSSASMRTKVKVGTKYETRFQRAVNEVKTFASEIIENDGYFSVIIADNDPSYLKPQRATKQNEEEFITELNSLVGTNDVSCMYGEADIEKAIALCEEVFNENPKAQIYLYTDVSYDYVPEGITVNNVSKAGEWNAAILNAYTEMSGNYYSFVVEVACYGNAQELEISVDVQGRNALDKDDDGDIVSFTTYVECGFNETAKVLFINKNIFDNDPNLYLSSYDAVETISSDEDQDDRVATYKSIHVQLNEADNLEEDNAFDIYNGLKEVIKIQYQSGGRDLETPNPFVPAALEQIRREYSDRWDIQIDEVKAGLEGAVEGYDFYVFEHQMPATMPTDGVVMLFDPDKAPQNAGFKVEATVGDGKQDLPIQESVSHEVLRHVPTDEITISQYRRTSNYQGAYEILWTCDNYPILAIKNEPSEKVVVLNFSVHYSTIARLPAFPMLFTNLFDYFFPSTVYGNTFEVNQNVTLRARGTTLLVTSNSFEKTFDTFPAMLSVDKPGQYTLTQTTFAGKEVVERIFVKIPATESYINRSGEVLTNPYEVIKTEDFYRDWMFYIAAAITAILFIEWLLSSRNGV